MSFDENDSASSSTPTSVAVYRDQVEQWIRAQHKLMPTQPIPPALQTKYIVRALRHSCGGDENDENEQQELRRAIEDFQKIVLTKLPSGGGADALDMILAPCRKTDKHAQPCLCPFLWFTVRRYPNGFCSGCDNAAAATKRVSPAPPVEEEILSDGEN